MSEGRVDIVKVSPTGEKRVRYEGELIPGPEGWIVARARWVHGDIDLGYLEFRNGDYLDEYFALEHPYNAFALYRDDHTFVGWYCNVTHPTTVSRTEIQWHDLFVDVIVYPDGRTLVLDEDELENSGLETTDPKLFRMIISGRDELLRLVETGSYPFSEVR